MLISTNSNCCLYILKERSQPTKKAGDREHEQITFDNSKLSERSLKNFFVQGTPMKRYIINLIKRKPSFAH